MQSDRAHLYGLRFDGASAGTVPTNHIIPMGRTKALPVEGHTRSQMDVEEWA